MLNQPLYPKEFDLEVLRKRCLPWKFFSSPFYTLFNKGSFLFVFELFQKYSLLWPLRMNIVFLLLLLRAIVIILGIALINEKSKSVIVFAIILLSSGIEGDS